MMKLASHGEKENHHQPTTGPLGSPVPQTRTAPHRDATSGEEDKKKAHPNLPASATLSVPVVTHAPPCAHTTQIARRGAARGACPQIFQKTTHHHCTPQHQARHGNYVLVNIIITYYSLRVKYLSLFVFSQLLTIRFIYKITQVSFTLFAT
jgi:hypothetical protein